MRGQAFNRWATSLGTCVSAATGKSYSDQIQTSFSLGMCSAGHVADCGRCLGHMVNIFF